MSRKDKYTALYSDFYHQIVCHQNSASASFLGFFCLVRLNQTVHKDYGIRLKMKIRKNYGVWKLS